MINWNDSQTGFADRKPVGETLASNYFANIFEGDTLDWARGELLVFLIFDHHHHVHDNLSAFFVF